MKNLLKINTVVRLRNGEVRTIKFDNKKGKMVLKDMKNGQTVSLNRYNNDGIYLWNGVDIINDSDIISVISHEWFIKIMFKDGKQKVMNCHAERERDALYKCSKNIIEQYNVFDVRAETISSGKNSDSYHMTMTKDGAYFCTAFIIKGWGE